MIDVIQDKSRLIIELWHTNPRPEVVQHVFRSRTEVEAFVRRLTLLCHATFPQRGDRCLTDRGDEDANAPAMSILPLPSSHTHTSQVLSGEQLLLAAILHQALADARNRSEHPSCAYYREDARRWLRIKENVVLVCDLLELDVEWIYPRLLAAAGMEEDP